MNRERAEHEHAMDVAQGVIPALRVATLDEFVDVEEPGADALVGAPGDALIPEGGDVMFYGDGGAGKTTLCIDLACHLAAGDDWLGFPIARAVSVLLVENEGPRPQFRAKLKRKRDGWTGSPLEDRVRVLEEPWASITLPEWREDLSEAIADLEVDVLVLGPVTRSGMNEAGTLQEVRDFMELVSALRASSGRSLAIVLVHHENKGGSVSGAWEGAGDTLFHVQGQGHGRTRLYVQKARWASAHHATTLHLLWSDGDAFSVEEREEITEATLADAILAAARELPGAAWTVIRERVKGKSTTEATAVRDRLIRDGLLVNTPKRKGGFNLWAADDPAVNRSEAGTDPERLPFSSPERKAGDASVLPFHRSKGTVDTERNGRPGFPS